MPLVVFRMIQLHQRLDQRILNETDQRVSNSLEVFRLKRLRWLVKHRLRELAMKPAPA